MALNVNVETSETPEGDLVFFMNGLRQKVIDAAAGEEIIFDQSDASNDGHRLRIALYPDGAHLGGGSEYTVGVTVSGTPGQAGAKTTFTVSNASLHGTYFYYCESHRYMGGMIHYGSDSIPQVPDASQPTVPAKYRLIDEGATAYDAQDEDLTSDIVKTVEQKNELTTHWDHVWDETTTHSNPWAVQNTDTRNTVQYRIRYEVQDSAGVAATARQKSINILTAAPQTFESTTWFLIHGTYLGQIQPGQNFYNGSNNTLWSSPGGYNGNTGNFHPTIRVFPDLPSSCNGGTTNPPATRYPPKNGSPCNGSSSFVGSPFVIGFYGQVTFYDDGTYYVWTAEKAQKFGMIGDNSGTYTETSEGIEIYLPKATTNDADNMNDPSLLQSMTILGNPQEPELHCTSIKSLNHPNMSLDFMVAVKLTDPDDMLEKPTSMSTMLRWNGGTSVPNNGTDVITV